MSKTTTFQPSQTHLYYDWSSDTNWPQGAPVDFDSVIEQSDDGTDDIALLRLSKLTLSVPLTVLRVLTTGTLVTSSGASITVSRLGGSASFTMAAQSGSGVTFTASGTNDTFIDTAAVDTGDTYVASAGGTVELNMPVASASALEFSGAGVIALFNPGRTTAAKITGINGGATIELPGTSSVNVVMAAPVSGAQEIDFTTSAGAYALSGIAVGSNPIVNTNATLDAATGLEAYTLRSADVFTATVASGTGAYLWSNAANWSEGVPLAGDTVVTDAAGTDDVAGLALASLTLGAGLTTTAGLSVGTLTFNTPASVTVTAGTLTAGTLSGSGSTIKADGAGAQFVSTGSVDPGETYIARDGGTIALAAPVSGNSTLGFDGVTAGVIALSNPGSLVAARIMELSAADTIELPGASATGVTIGAAVNGVQQIVVVTPAGTVTISNVRDNGANPITNYTAAHDATSGLEAFTFRLADAFSPTVASASGAYLWSNPSNWSEGVPVAGDTVTVSGPSTDDISSLGIGKLVVGAGQLTLTGRLTVGTLDVTSASTITPTGYAALDLTAISGTGASLTSFGGGAAIFLHGTVDPGEVYTANNSGALYFHTAVASTSTLDLVGSTGLIELYGPAATVAAPIVGLNSTDLLELAGTSVSRVTFGMPVGGVQTITVVTNAGTTTLSHVVVGTGLPFVNYTAVTDLASNLEQFTFRTADTFTRAVAGANAQYLWSNAANWSEGVPVAGDTVVMTGAGTDDLASLSLASLTAASGGFVVLGTLALGTLVDNGTTAITIGAPATLTVGAITGSGGGSIAASGAGAKFVDTAATDPGETYLAGQGGTIELAAPVANSSTLHFSGAGVIALSAPAAITAARLSGISAAATLELPGTAEFGVQFSTATGGTPQIQFTAPGVAYSFTNVGYAGAAATNATVTPDATTGLEAIAFRLPDVFAAVATPTWTSPANWSEGVPVAGDSVVLSTGLSTDNVLSLSLGAVTLASGTLDVAATLSAGALTLAAASRILVVGSLSFTALSGGGSTIDVAGANALVVDKAASDPGESFSVSSGATLELFDPLSSASTLDFAGIGSGKIAYFGAAASIGAALHDIGAGDTLEVQGTLLTGISVGTSGLAITTDQGTWTFGNVRFASNYTGVAWRVDPATGLLALNFDPPADQFQQSVAATSGPGTGGYLWSNAANWSAGVPATGRNVSVGAASIDDLAALSLSSLAVAGNTALQVSGGELDIGALNLGTGSLKAAPTGGSGRVVIGALAAASGSRLQAFTAGSTIVVQGSLDPGTTYAAANGGTVEVSAPLAAASTLGYSGAGDIVLFAPQAQIAASLTALAQGDTLELPGSSVSNVTLGGNSLAVTTSAGTFSFSNVTYDGLVRGDTVAQDGTGEVAVAFTATDSFQQAAAATSGPAAGGYAWSNAANWTAGVPASGFGVQVGALGYDDLAQLTLPSLTEAAGGGVVVVGGTLSAGALTAGAGNELLALGVAAAAAATVSGITGSGGLFGALGAAASFTDGSTLDPGATYVAQAGGTVTLAAAPAAASTLQFNGAGTFVLTNPGTAVAAGVAGIVAGDRIELPGTEVLGTTLGATSLGVTTNLGTTSFATLGFAGGVTGVSAGRDAATGLSTLTFTDQARSADFNGDGTSDQLWQASTGALIDYAMASGSITGAAIVGSLDGTYKFLGTGDFNGDGTADQLWQAGNGAIIDYAMQNGSIAAATIVGALDPTFRFLAAADFNGDGTTDQLWQAATGAIVDFSMQNGAITGATGVGALDATWTFLAAADFNGDGTADQLWQAGNGTVVDYAMNNGTISSANVVGAFGAGMKFLAAADFNGDGRADMLWQNTATGALVDYTMNGAAITATATVGALDATWKFLAAGVFNGDGTADQLWQNTGGAIVDFTMRNGAITGGAVVGTLDGTFKFLA